MEIKHLKAPTLFSLFLKYLIAFCVSNLMVAAIFISLFLYALNSGFILPANYAQMQLTQSKEALESSQPFDEDLIPFTCTYALFDKDGRLLEGNMEKTDIEKAQTILSGNGQTAYKYFFFAEREDGYCFVQYDMLTHFASPRLHRIIGKPELLFIILFIACFILLTILTAMKFGKKLKTQLAPLIAATNAIKEQELTFQITPTKVKEFNAVLDSIEDMKVALKESLEHQWEEEQNRRTQMAALTHDIKTPLTLVKGNAELLMESELQKEPLELAKTIHHSSEKIEQYLALLMDTAIIDNLSAFTGEVFSIDDLITEISVQAKALCQPKQLDFTLLCKKTPDTFYGDKTLIFRGVMNILDNAAEHSPLQGKISFCVRRISHGLELIVTDEGKGFSAASLKQAANQFYTEQQERSGKHYGIGLYLAKSVAEKHGGMLTLSNHAEGGAVVTLTLCEMLKEGGLL